MTISQNISPNAMSCCSCYCCNRKREDRPSLANDSFLSLKNMNEMMLKSLDPSQIPNPKWDSSFLECLSSQLRKALTNQKVKENRVESKPVNTSDETDVDDD